MDCIRGELHWIESSIFLLNCIRLRSRMQSGQMGILWIAIKLDWIGLETRRGIVGEISARGAVRMSKMPTPAGSQFFLGVL